MAALPAESGRVDPVRVVVVDDNEDLRVLLRLHFMRDGRFVVVGEAADGREAIAVAEAQQPDVMVLDRRMPILDGLEAMPDIRRVSPNTAIVLYTANEDPWSYQAAVDAGALGVLEKIGIAKGFVDKVVKALVQRSDHDALVKISVGPVSAEAARIWIANTRAIVESFVANPDVVGATIPADILELFESFFDEWSAVADGGEVFRWVARAPIQDVKRIVSYWATIDGMTDEQLEQLGVRWSPPEGQPFFQALTTGILETLQHHEMTERLAERLIKQWAPFRTD
ncbi:MAG: response regulator transcription factor [Actinomycetota bacterium]